MFWGESAPLPSTGRDLAIAAGAELDELDHEQEGRVNSNNSHSGSQPGEDAPKRVTKSAGRRTALNGGVPVVAKPITRDYNEDDARIIQLKQQNHTDEYVAEIFKQEGRPRYTSKTIGSRWQKLRKILNDANDEKLDDELSDWHVGEDDHLKSTFDALEEKYKELAKKLEEKKWAEVSAIVEYKLGERKYTAKACKERWLALKDGSALLPIELDVDQEGRRKLREDRIAAAKQARKAELDKVRDVEERKKARADALKREKAVANQKMVSSKLQRDKEKRERERVKDERNTNRLRLRREKNAILRLLRAERDWRREKKRQEKILYQKLTGKEIVHGSGSRRTKTKDGYESEEAEESLIDEFESDAEMSDLGDDDEGVPVLDDDLDTEDEEEAAAPVTPAPAPTPGARRSSRQKKTPASKSSEKKPALAGSSPKPTPSKSKGKSLASAPKQTAAPVANMAINALVTKETLRNPRSILSDDELAILLVMRDLPRRGPNESHAEVVARVDQVDRSLKSDDLGALLIQASEKSKGKKVEKVHRLQMADANKSEAGQMGVASTDLDFMQRYEGYNGEFRYLVDEAVTEMTSWWGKDSVNAQE